MPRKTTPKNTDTVIEDVSETPDEVTTEETTTEPLHTTAELAELFNTDAKTLRRFLRRTLTPESLPGKGGRYRIPSANLAELQRRFAATGSNKATPMNFKGESDETEVELDD